MTEPVFRTADFVRAVTAVAAGSKAATEELNAQDGQLGDGDLGITVAAGFQAVADIAPQMPADIGRSFLDAAEAFQQVSSSSFGTMVASTFMAVGRRTRGRTEIPLSDVAGLLEVARDAMIARGKGALGDKSVLDSVEAVRRALAGIDDPAAAREAAIAAARSALEVFRDRPNRLGRARMFAERSIGLDDPGMLAFCRIVESLP